MEEFEEIQRKIENYIFEKNELQQKINEIEEQRMILAEQRNIEKYRKNSETFSEDDYKIEKLGRQIKVLGDESQLLQNQINKKFIETKNNIIREIKLKLYSILIENVTKEVDIKHKENIEIIKKNEKEIDKLEKINKKIRKSRWLEFDKINSANIYEDSKKIVIDKEQKKDENKEIKIDHVQENKKDINVSIIEILVKIKNNKLIYIAKMNNGNNIEIPVKQLLNVDKEEIENIIINYSISKYKIFDKTVLKKIDFSICELIMEIARIFDFDYKEYLYNYIMSFSKKEGVEIYKPFDITYDISFIKESKIDINDKKRIKRICKNAKMNNNINVIGYISKILEIIYNVYNLRKILNHNKIKRLAEAKE